MHNVKMRLDAWRDAERHRDGFAPDSPEWEDAEDEVRAAQKRFEAEVAQESARYVEAGIPEPGRGWSSQLDRRGQQATD